MSEWKRLRGKLKPEDEHPETGGQDMARGASAASNMLLLAHPDLEGEVETAVQDALTNLMHLCDREDIDWEDVLGRASRMADWEAGVHGALCNDEEESRIR